MKVLVLWQGMSGYFNASLMALAELGVPLALAHQAPVTQAPFEQSMFDWLQPQHMWSGQPDVQRVFELDEALDPDVVLVSSWHIHAYRKYLLSQRGRRRIRVLCMDNQWLETPKQWMGRLTARWYVQRPYDLAFVPGDRQARFARYLGFNEHRILRGLYSADVPAFANASQKQRERALLFVGRLAPEKGLDTLLDAYAIYRSQVSAPWPLRVVGTGPMQARFDNAPGIERLGFVQPSALADVMSRHRVLLLPSRYEPWGVVVHEAVAAGMIPVCSDAVGASQQFVVDGFNGFVAPVGRPAEFARVLRRLTKHTDDELELMSRRSRELAGQLTPQRWAKYLVDELCDL